MSYRLPNTPNAPPSDYDSQSTSSAESVDDGCSDWASDLGEALRTTSLFDTTLYATPEEAIKNDKNAHSIDIREIKDQLGLDVYGLMRLVNLIRKEKLSAPEVLALNKDDQRLKDDGFLVPVIPDDPLLREYSSPCGNTS